MIYGYPTARVVRERRRRRREYLDAKRTALVDLLARDEQEWDRLNQMTYAQLVCVKNGSGPTLFDNEGENQ